jgi:glycosyltransferase involved in cell wall biosynthesis
MPLALEQLDLSSYDLVVSSESGPAKGVLTRPGQLHVCYCHTPMRYAWDMYHEYRRGLGFAARKAMAPVMHYMRLWDRLSADRVDHFAANSAYVASRIRKHWRREATIIHPPVDVDAFAPSGETGGPYLFVGHLTAYKRADLAVRAASEMDRELWVVGDGPERSRLESMAGSGVRFLGRLEGPELARTYAACRALIFPGLEDFGIVPVEAMAAGRPVIAYGAGGALETVLEGETGLFFSHRSVESLTRAIRRFEEREADFDPGVIAAHAGRFGRDVFKERFTGWVDTLMRGEGEA